MPDDGPHLELVTDEKTGKAKKPNSMRPSRVVAAERRRQALGLRRNGATYEMIAEALDVSISTVRRYIKDALEQIQLEINETSSEVRELELQRLDAMLRQIAPHVEDAAKEGDWRPMQMQLRIMERRAKLLGLDAAAKHEHTGRVAVEHGIERSEIDDLEKMWRDSGDTMPPIDGDAVPVLTEDTVEPADPR